LQQRREITNTIARCVCTAIGMLLAGCGSDVLARILGEQAATASRPIDVQAWSDADETELPTVDSPFGEARVVDVAQREGAWVRTSVESPGDTRIYRLGSVNAGDRITVQAIPNAPSRLDPVVAIFDENMNWLSYNDDRLYYDRQIDALMDFKAAAPLKECFVVVSSSPRSETSGDFDLYISRESGSPPTPKPNQVIYLEFSGQANVVVGRRSPVHVPAFRGSAIAPEFDVQTQALVDGIVARVQQDFEPFDVTILSSQWSARPFRPHTTVYFGSVDPALLGISDNIDTDNEFESQEAIVFVDSFSLFMSASPSVEQLVDVIANVASHEIGHLLGLRHTSDPTAIMDTTATVSQMLEQQSFHRAPLHPATFSVGYQDPVARLLGNVGASSANRKKAQLNSDETDGIENPQPGISARSFCDFGTACADSSG